MHKLSQSVAILSLGVMSAISGDLPAVDQEFVTRGDTPADVLLDEQRDQPGSIPAADLERWRNAGKRQAALAAYQLGLGHAANREWDKAGAMLKEAVMLQPDNPDYLHAAAQLSYQLEDYAAARTYQLETLRLYREIHGEFNRAFARLTDELAVICVSANHFLDAEILLQKSLGLREALLDQGDPELALSLFRLATVKIHRGDLQTVEQQLKKALDILRAAAANQDSNIAAVLHNLGELYRIRHQFEQAQAAYEEAMVLWKRDPEGHAREISMTRRSLEALDLAGHRLSDGEGRSGSNQDQSIRL